MKKTIDITPAGLRTQDGIERTNKAVSEFNDSTAQVANLATELFDMLIQSDLFTPVRHQYREEIAEMKSAIELRRDRQEEFLRAIAGAPKR